MAKTVRWYDIYRGYLRGNWQQFRNNVTIPLLFATVWGDVARKMNISFGTYPYVSFFGFGPEDAEASRLVEILVSAQMKDADTMLKCADILLTGDIYGTAIAQVGWDKRTASLIRRESAPVPGRPRESLRTEPRTVFDGPNWEPVDILDFFPQPSRRDIKDMDWVCRRYWLDLEEIQKMAFEDGVFDKAAVDQLTSLGAFKEVRDDLTARRNQSRGPLSESETRRMEKYAKPVELIEMRGRAPNEFIPDDGGDERIITVANRSITLRDRPNPYWHGEKGYLIYSPLRDPHYFHGTGKIEIGEKLQLTANRLANHKLDALDLVLDPMWYNNRAAGIDTRKLYARPGRIVSGDGPMSEALSPISPDLSGMSLTYQEIGELERMLERGTGVTSDALGLQAEPRETARAFMGRQENVSVRLLLESRFFEEMFFEPLANMFHALNQQFLPMPKKVRILGTAAMVNPITGMPAMPVEEVTLEDINKDYDTRAKGAITTISKASRQQNMTLLLQAVSSNPLAVQAINWNAFIRELFQAFEVQNIDEVLAPNPMQMMATQQMGAGGAQPQVPGTPNQAMDLMSLLPLPGAAQMSQQEGQVSGP
jgi:hypothetical protein